MNAAQRDAFLDRPFCAIVTTLEPDGAPHPVPTWYRWDGERILLWGGEGRRWMRNLERDSRVAVAIHQHEEPYSAVLVRGRAEVRWGRDDETFAEIRRIVARYVDPGDVDDTITRYDAGGLHAVVTITPEWLRAWDVPP